MTDTGVGQPGPRVLIIDPFADECDMYGEYLRHRGFAVDVCSDAAEGLRAAVGGRPDIVVTRLRQTGGGVDGIGIVRVLKGNALTSEVPVVMITTSDLEADRRAAADAACDAYLLLPLTPAELDGALRRLLEEATA